jgi:hypothetical protein
MHHTDSDKRPANLRLGKPARLDPIRAPPPLPPLEYTHGLINYKDTKTKCRGLKKLTFKGSLRQLFIRVYGLEIQSLMLVFSTQLCQLLPLLPSL